MKGFLFAMALVFGLPALANGAFPSPKPAPMDATAPVIVAPAPIAPAPQIVEAAKPASPGWSFNDILAVINTVLLGGGVGALAKGVFAPKAAAPAGSAEPFKPKVSDLLSLVKDPAARKRLDEQLFAIVESGIPGKAIQAAAGLVPGAGSIATVVEPMVRSIVADALAQRAAANTPPASP